MALVVAWETIIRDVVPVRSGGDERVELRLYAGLAVERAEADCDLFALWPFRAKEARAADRAKRLRPPAARSKDPDQLLTGKQAEAVARNASLRFAECARMLPAARTVAQRNGAVTSKRTPPQRHEPWSGLSGLGSEVMSRQSPRQLRPDRVVQVERGRRGHVSQSLTRPPGLPVSPSGTTLTQSQCQNVSVSSLAPIQHSYGMPLDPHPGALHHHVRRAWRSSP